MRLLQSAQRMPTKGFVAIQAFHHFSVAAGLNAHVIADHRHHLPQDAESCTASMAASGCTVHPMGVDYLPSLESSIQFRDSSRGQGSEPSVSLSLSAPSSCLTATLLSLQQRYRRTNDALKPAERHPRDANKTDPPVLHIKEPSSGSQATMQSPACKSGTPISTAPSLKHADMLSQSLQGTKQECPRKLIRKISGQ